MRHVVMMALPVLSFGMSGSADAGVSLTLVPPGVITEQVTLDVRGAVRNDTDEARTFDVAFYLDEESEEEALHRERVEVPGRSARGVSFRWPSTGHAGGHRVIVVATCDDEVWRMDRPIQVLASDVRSTGKLNGAWVDIYHHDEAEAVPFNEELSKMTDTQWRELVRAMNRVDQNILVMTMMFQNFTHVGKHAIETEGYHGKAYYPSKRYPGRMPIAAEDPLEAILDEADRLGMYVFPGVGMYAFFDFTPASLEWHKAVADELWERYGHHDSFYGWYVSEEIAGNLGRNDARREELVAFFKAFGDHVRRLAPDKPVMLATNCHSVARANGYYEKLLPHLDILCPFGFARMPARDLAAAAAAMVLQRRCDAAGCHLWMDLESFVFRNGAELHPRPVDGVKDDLSRFPQFETVLHYQFPGLMSSPEMTRKPGGGASVKLYLDYEAFLRKGE